MIRLALLACLTVGCAQRRPDLYDMSCAPHTLSASAKGRVNLTCVVKFDGPAGDGTFSAENEDGTTWTSGELSSNGYDKEIGEILLSMGADHAPPVGRLTVVVSVEGDGGDTISLVVPVYD